jgi:hypothetical protein
MDSYKLNLVQFYYTSVFPTGYMTFVCVVAYLDCDHITARSKHIDERL